MRLKTIVISFLVAMHAFAVRAQSLSRDYIMDFIGGEIKQAGDNNRWTDNVIGKEDAEMHLASPDAGKSKMKLMAAAEK